MLVNHQISPETPSALRDKVESRNPKIHRSTGIKMRPVQRLDDMIWLLSPTQGF